MKFGRPPLHSRHLTDRSGRLALNEMPKLRGQLDLFERKFPQSLFSIFITELPPDTSIGEYAFWLANRGRFSSIEVVGSENFGLLLVIDTFAGAAALTVGYGLEKYLQEADLADILSSAEPMFREGDLAGGIAICIDRAVQRMREISMQLEADNASEKSMSEMTTTGNTPSSAIK